MTRLVPAAAVPLLIIAASADARPREAKCVVKSQATTDYRGPCRSRAEAKGSFSIEPVGRRSFPNEVSAISVSIVSPGVAEVRGLTRDGVNSRWGEARRSQRHPACWLGSDFAICVYRAPFSR